MLDYLTLPLGPLETNTYLIADSESGEAIVIDPAWDGNTILAEADKHNWHINQIWITHAHFDHIGGVSEMVESRGMGIRIALHPEEIRLWRQGGGALLFGIKVPSLPEPHSQLNHGQVLSVGRWFFEVRHAPGHTRGHVIFYCPEAALLFSGDVIFQGGVGRTDLPGGSYQDLIESIRTQIFTLPLKTQILPGHGPATTVGEEIENLSSFLS